jgi:hypothetical protein
MSAYWDSSALVQASLDERDRLSLAKEGGFKRTHSFAEVFSTLTGGRLGFRCQAEDAAKICREIANDLECVELSLQETLAALDEARRLGVRGGHIHDFLHLVAARKAGADKAYTLNLDDFRGPRARIEIAVPQ